MTTPQMDWLDDERRRLCNATPWLPPARTDPRLETRSWRIAVDVADGDGAMKDAVDILNEEIQRLRALLADLLADCDNWGCAPDGRYAEALR